MKFVENCDSYQDTINEIWLVLAKKDGNFSRKTRISSWQVNISKWDFIHSFPMVFVTLACIMLDNIENYKIIRKNVSPILNIILPPFISTLAGLALKSQPVKSIFFLIELRYLYEILYNVFLYIRLLSPKISHKNIEK